MGAVMDHVFQPNPLMRLYKAWLRSQERTRPRVRRGPDY